ncbi:MULTISPECIES: hypothetical protein [Sulfurimonas]|uniref:hypothetical protein n=1 Tax=Sulfurimonas TaxID=202746 RepID=UPI00125F32D8|nr:hypothetical protein [Sulfurimonas hydrogeniphila]
MSKLFQALLSGMFFTFILDFFIILGVKLNYIDFYGVHVYYNILFADHQNFFLFLFFSILLGYLVVYASTKTALIVIGSLFVLSFATLIPPIGKSIGEMMLMKKNITLKTDKFFYHGDLYYDGRKNVTFYDYELKKVIILDKNKIRGQY